MPTVINGVGTWYYGKRNVHGFKSICEFCNRAGVLESYDTTLFFVVVFVPIIPLNKQRIIKRCPSCQKHRVLGLKQWQKIKNESVTEALGKVTQNPHDSDAISNALLTASSFQDEELFEKLIVLSEGKTGDAKVQAALGSAYGYFNRREEAIEALKNSLRARDDNSVRELLADNYLRKGEPENARPLYQHVFDERKGESVWLPNNAIETCQRLGMHQEALEIMEAREAAFPEYARQKPFLKQKAVSQKNLTTGKRIATAHLIDSEQVRNRPTSSSRRPYIVLPAILLLGFLIYVSIAFWKGQNRKIYLVNGSSKAYEVAVNGEKVSLNPNRVTPYTVAEGTVRVEVPAPELKIDAVEGQVETPFWERPFTNPVFVFNPDGLGLIEEETATYALNNPPPNSVPNVHFGNGFYQLIPVDYEFEPFPASLTVKGSQTVTKKRVYFEPVGTTEALLNRLETIQIPAKQIELAKRRARLQPDDFVMLGWLKLKLPPAEMVDFLKERLEDKPILVDWHRVYQMSRFQLDPKVDLRSEYEQRVKSDPNPDAKYLLARISDDPEAARLMEESSKSTPPSAYSQYSLGYRYLSLGQFPEAIQWLDSAVKLKPANVQFQNVLWNAYLAAGQYDKFQSALDQSNATAPTARLLLKLQAAARKNDLVLMQNLRNQFTALVRGPVANPAMNPALAKLNQALDLTVALAAGNINRFMALSRDVESQSTFAYQFLIEKYQEASTYIDARDGRSAIEYWGLLNLAARKKKNQILENESWKQLQELMSHEDRQLARAAELLKSNDESAPKQLLNLYVEPDIKRVLLLIAADRTPNQATELRTLALKLNYMPDVTALCIKKISDEKPAVKLPRRPDIKLPDKKP